MSLILSIETATQACSVALSYEGKLVACQTLCIERSHAESLLPMIVHLLAMSPYTKEDLAAIAISEGPGSYTGLRIGVSTAKGLAYGLGTPLFAINTLAAMARGVAPYNLGGALLCPMIDARRMEVYCMILDATGKEVLVAPHPHVVTENSFCSWLEERPVLFFGDGAAKCQPVLGGHRHAVFLDDIYPSAQHVGALAYHKLQQKVFADLASFEPMYLK